MKGLKIIIKEHVMNKKSFLCKFIYNIHKWDWIQCEFKSVYIKSLTKILYCVKYMFNFWRISSFFSSIWFCKIKIIIICDVIQIIITRK